MALNLFNSVKGLHPRRNSFSAHTYRNDFTSTLGVNIPVYIQHVPAAARVRVSTSALIRLQAMTAPIMDNVDFYVHFWKIAYRLIEDDRFTQFLTGEIEPELYESIFDTCQKLGSLIAEKCELFGMDAGVTAYNKIVGDGSLLDFCGYDRALFPTAYVDDDPELGETIKVNEDGNDFKKFNFRNLVAYYMLHLNWYMNENVPYWEGFDVLVKELPKLTGDDGLDSLADLLVQTYKNFETTLLPHGWEKDYFTSALPNVQYGDPVTLPIAGTAPVSIPPVSGKFIEFGNIPDNDSYYGIWSNGGNVHIHRTGGYAYLSSTAENAEDPQDKDDDAYLRGINVITPSFSGTADLSEATAITINELRFANALQVFKERQMRYGRRRLEYYKGFFDVEPEDMRLQLPKYLGGGRIPINIADIEQTSATSSDGALGHLAGKATAVAGGFAGFSTFCSEETVIIGIAFAMPHITYSQNVSRFLFKTNDIYDYFNPSFEHLGEQEIEKLEVWAGAVSDGVFGYTPRYTEYRFHNNELHGEFKNTLAYWNLGRIFLQQPALNAKFVYMQPSVFNRIFAVQSSIQQSAMLASMLFRQRIIQPVSKYGTPMLLA